MFDISRPFPYRTSTKTSGLPRELRNCNCRKNPFLFLEYSISKLRLTPLPGSYERTVPTPSRPSLILCHGMELLPESEAVPPAYLLFRVYLVHRPHQAKVGAVPKWQTREDLGAPGSKPRGAGRGTTCSQGIHERDGLIDHLVLRVFLAAPSCACGKVTGGCLPCRWLKTLNRG